MATQQSRSSKSKTSKRTKAVKPISKEEATNYEGEDIKLMIAEAAYYHAERRGFMGGDMDEDWSLAEAEIDSMLSQEKPH